MGCSSFKSKISLLGSLKAFGSLIPAGSFENIVDGAHSKYNGKDLNREYAKFAKAFLASEGSKNSTNPIVLVGGTRTYSSKVDKLKYSS